MLTWVCCAETAHLTAWQSTAPSGDQSPCPAPDRDSPSSTNYMCTNTGSRSNPWEASNGLGEPITTGLQLRCVQLKGLTSLHFILFKLVWRGETNGYEEHHQKKVTQTSTKQWDNASSLTFWNEVHIRSLDASQKGRTCSLFSPQTLYPSWGGLQFSKERPRHALQV